MTVTEQPPVDTAPKETTKPAAVPATGGPSVRTVATVAGVIAAAAIGVITFVAGGWIGLAAAGGVAAVGGVATARAKNPRPRKTKPGLLTALVGRPRKPGKSSGTLPWSLTGSQSGRATKGAGMRGGMKSGRATTGRAGTGLKMPAVTAKGRAKKAAAKAGHPLATTRPARPVAKTAKTAKAATVKKTAGPGKGRASTPTKTPAKPTAKKLVTGTTPKTKGATAGPKASTARPRLATAKKPGARPSTGRVSNGGKGATILPFKRTGKKATGRPTGTGVRRTGTAGGRRPGTGVTKPGMKFPRMSHGRRTATGLRGTIGGKRLGKTTGGPTTKKARRLATPKAGRVLRGRAAAVPNRTPRRPTTGTGPATKRRLIGTALRVPRRNKLRFRRPTKAQARKARRTLHLRSRIAGRRAWSALRSVPGRLWRARSSLRLWPVMPGPIDPAWLPPEPAPAEVAEKRRRVMHKIRTPYPQLVGRRAATTQKEHTTVSSTPLESITEALAQLTSFDPENALEIEQFMAGLGHVFTEFSSNLAGISDRWSAEQPLAAEVLEAIHQVASVSAGAADMADEAHATFQSAHEPELTRLREPRANEQAWDVTQNQ